MPDGGDCGVLTGGASGLAIEGGGAGNASVESTVGVDDCGSEGGENGAVGGAGSGGPASATDGRDRGDSDVSDALARPEADPISGGFIGMV